MTEQGWHPWLRGTHSALMRGLEDPSLVLKRFGAGWSARDVAGWAELTRRFGREIAADPELRGSVEVLMPLKVGTDHVIRPFVELAQATSDFERVLPAYEQVRAWVSRHRWSPEVGPVARRSLGEPSNGTFWDSSRNRFVVADAKITHDEARKCG
jgi:hypothetical protein